VENAPSREEQSPSDDSVVDFQEVMARFAGDGEFLLTSLDLFRDRYPELLSEARRSLADRDYHRLERAAHSLKGSVGNFGAKAAMNAARDLEGAGRDRNADRAEEGLKLLEREIDRFVKAVGEFARGLTVGRGVH
jgi:HPt (histidine-containing phosphotransfer) domain-containing protein